MSGGTGGAMEPGKTDNSRVWFWLVGLGVSLALVHLLSDILMPFVVGMAVAYFLDPQADRLEALGASRTVAVTLITLAFFVILIAVLALLGPLIQAQIMELAKRVPDLVEAVRDQVEPFLEHLRAGLTEDQAKKIKGAAGAYAGDAVAWLGGMLQRLVTGGLAFFNMVSLVVIAPIVSFYLLRDYDRIVAWVDGYLPRDAAPVIREQVKAIDGTVSAFLRGQALVCLVLAIYYSVGLTIVGLDFGLLVGLGAGLISFIPYIGASIGLVTGVGIALVQFPDWGPVLIVAAVFIVGQTAESYILQPRLVGERVGLHPVWLIFALLAGGALFGFTGVLLAVPVAAVIGVLVRFWLGRYKESRFFLGGEGA